MSQSVAPAGSIVRLTVVGEDRRLDVGVPSQLPLVELIPGFARSLGVLDPSLAHGGYALRRSDGRTLDAAASAAAQGVEDGEVLTLARGTLLSSPRVYDDVVEAVIDATAEQHDAWTPADSGRTALAVSLSFLALCGVLLAGMGPGATAALIAGGGAVVLLAASAVVGRLGPAASGNALGLAAAGFAGLAGYLAVPSGDLWGWPLAAAGLGLLVGGGIALALAAAAPEVHAAPMGLGLLLGATATVTAVTGFDPTGPYAVMIAVAALLSNGLPWLALASTRIRVVSAQTDAEIFADPEPVDAAEVRARTAAGQRSLVALRLALGLGILGATPLVAGANPAGAALCALAFVGLMFQSRQSAARASVLVLMSVGALGLAVTGLTIAAAQPDLHGILLVVLLVATAILIVLTMLDPRVRLRLARLADTAEVIALALLLPLGVLAAGLV